MAKSTQPGTKRASTPQILDSEAQQAVSVEAEMPASYEAALAELETLVSSMEGPALGLEESLRVYRRGMVLVEYCRQQLERIEQQVKIFDDESTKPLHIGSTDQTAN